MMAPEKAPVYRLCTWGALRTRREKAMFLAGGSTRSGLNPEAHLSLFPQVTSHRHDDDLLTAGLGLAGLRAPAAPAFARAEAPTPAELRRRAVWQSWRGIADLTPGGGFGEVYGSAADVPGREYAAFATLPGARHPHRIVVQVPDAFDRARRCLLVEIGRAHV